MRSKGFTLIELLAVIVILAIVALIATPIVLNVIEDSRQSAALVSANNYKSALELALSRKMMNDNSFKIKDGMYNVMTNGNLCLGAYSDGVCYSDILEVEVDGEKPTAGMVFMVNSKIVRINELKIGNYLLSNSFGSSSMELAASTYDTWDGVSATALDQLQKDDVAKTVSVNSAADLAGVRNAVNSGQLTGYAITLNTSIDLGGNTWEPIGVGVEYDEYTEGDAYFTGTLNGNGYTIKGLNVVEENSSNGVGLFGGVVGDIVVENLILQGTVTGNGKTAGGLIGFAKDYDGTVTNLTVKNSVIDVDVTSIDTVGSVAARLYTTGTVTIEGVKNTGTMTSTAQKASSGKVGGIVGFNKYANTLTITDCQNEGTLSGGGFVAGAVGYLENGNAIITRFINNGEVTSYAQAGGAVAFVYKAGTLTIDSSTNNANISGTGTTNSHGTGGLIGASNRPITITNSTNNGNITNNASHAGGILGIIQTDFKVDNCTNTGTVHATVDAGGIIGWASINGVQDPKDEYKIYLTNNNGGTSAITVDNGAVGRIMGTFEKGYTTLLVVEGNTGSTDIPLFGTTNISQS